MTSPKNPSAVVRPSGRAAAWMGVGRPALTLTAILLIYFLVPWTRYDRSSLIWMVIGLLAAVGLMAWQIAAILRARFPAFQAAEAVSLFVSVYLLTFSATYYVMDSHNPTAFTEPMDKVGALYFTLSVLTTVGFGDITATIDMSRAVVSLQMGLNFVLVAGLIRVLWAAVDQSRKSRADDDRRGQGN